MNYTLSIWAVKEERSDVLPPIAMNAATHDGENIKAVGIFLTLEQAEAKLEELAEAINTVRARRIHA